MPRPVPRSAALLLASLFAALLAACGGGESGPNPYVAGGGVTVQARIGMANAEAIALGVYDAGVSSGTLSGEVPLAPAGPAAAASGAAVRGAAAARAVVALATRNLPAAGSTTPQGTRQTVDETEYDGAGGSVRLRGYADDASGEFFLTLTATNWHGDSGGILDGTMRASGQVEVPIVDPYDPVFVSMEISFSALTYTDASGSGTIHGSIGFEEYDQGTLFVELFLTDNGTRKTVWLNDVILRLGSGNDETYGDFTTGSITGRVYLHDYGYVDVNTPTPFRTYAGQPHPDVGELTLTGAMGRRVYLAVPDPDGADYEVLADVDGVAGWDVHVDGYWDGGDV